MPSVKNFAPPVFVVMDESEKSHFGHANFTPTLFGRSLNTFFLPSVLTGFFCSPLLSISPYVSMAVQPLAVFWKYMRQFLRE